MKTRPLTAAEASDLWSLAETVYDVDLTGLPPAAREQVRRLAYLASRVTFPPKTALPASPLVKGEEYLTTSQVAHMARVPDREVRRQISLGRLRAVKNGAHWQVTRTAAAVYTRQVQLTAGLARPAA
jgi:excisionase family DNA binding protein